jgi:hypothetical protein
VEVGACLEALDRRWFGGLRRAGLGDPSAFGVVDGQHLDVVAVGLRQRLEGADRHDIRVNEDGVNVRIVRQGALHGAAATGHGQPVVPDPSL